MSEQHVRCAKACHIGLLAGTYRTTAITELNEATAVYDRGKTHDPIVCRGVSSSSLVPLNYSTLTCDYEAEEYIRGQTLRDRSTCKPNKVESKRGKNNPSVI